MDTRKFFLYFSSIILFLFSSALYSQNFKPEILIDIPGNNYDFDLSASEFWPGAESYITWINQLDSVYTVYLKKISPEMGENIIVATDKNIKSNPQISWNHIAWENFKDSMWQILLYSEDSTNISILADSLLEEPQMVLSSTRAVWIDNHDLIIRTYFPHPNYEILLDSADCSSPDIVNYDDEYHAKIIYERIDSNKTSIYAATLESYPEPNWNFRTLSEPGSDNFNPKFGMYETIAFQTFYDPYWMVSFSGYGGDYIEILNNNFNHQNPVYFNYPVTTSANSSEKTLFMLAFESDSIENNPEIFAEYLYFEIIGDSLENISDTIGEDSKPDFAYLTINDTVYISIIWEHHFNGKTDIWMGKEIYDPISNDVNDKKILTNNFNLSQNHPNPFNPSTAIEFTLNKPGLIKLEIFDLLGNHITTLADGYLSSGKYKVPFMADHLSSGVYFYTLSSDGYIQTKSMLLVK